MSKLRLAYDLINTVVNVALVQVAEDESETVLKQFALDAAEYPESFTTGDEAVTKSLAGYGLQKLIQDRTSQVSGDVEKKFEAMLAEGERLKGGEWRAAVERSAGGATPKADPILAQAVAELQGLTIPVATAALAAMDKEKLAKLRANDRVKAVVDRIREESKAAATVDLGDLLGD